MSTSFNPLSNIALAISGGGFRAASFGLGAMAYLERLGLLKHVSFMSSASGGTMPAMLYSLYNHQGKSFADCYQHLCRCMDGETLLKKVFEILKEDHFWKERPEKNRNLINAFAIAYDELVFENALFGTYWNKKQSPHIQEVCFNATDFANGLSFRFQTGPNRKIGNYWLNFDNRISDNHSLLLQLGDIMASSSCFPGGFEPMVFPNDFTTKHINSAAIWAHFEQKPAYLNQYEAQHQAFGLMDGGIDDNQGVGSLILADEYRRRNNKDDLQPFDTIIVCDVDSSFTKPYLPPKPPKINWLNKLLFFQTPLFLVLALLLVVGIGLGLGVQLSFDTLNSFKNWGIALTVALLLTLFLVWRFIADIPSDPKPPHQPAKPKGTWGKMMVRYGGFFVNMPFGVLGAVIKSRLSSASLMIGDLFLNHVRRLHFADMYDDPHYHNINANQYANRCVSNLIHDLSLANSPNLLPRLNDRLGATLAKQLTPSKTLQDLAEETRKMDTTLWFDQHHKDSNMLNKLIACGQATMCFNLLKYLYELKTDATTLNLPELYTPELEALRTKIEADWHVFNQKPLSLLP
ncbi:MAG: patatin-like phospholipase family protein [Spirosomataceae bacterium]